MKQVVAMLLALMLASCTHVRSSQGVSLNAEGTWLVLPLVNRTGTPQAGLRAAAIVESVLYRQYVVSGVVHEWRYKTGVDGEPAVGVMLEIRELPSGKIVYSGTGARAGWARTSLSQTGQKVIDKLLAPVIR